MQHRVCSNLFS